MMAAFLLAPVLARRFGAVRAIVSFQLTSIPFFLILAFTTSLPLAVGAFLLRHACMNMVHPVGAHFAMEVARPGQRARVNGLRQAANESSWVAANFAGGELIRHAPFVVDGVHDDDAGHDRALRRGERDVLEVLRARGGGAGGPAPEAEPSVGG
jgi:MFS family permease